jgi:hypothetical protein
MRPTRQKPGRTALFSETFPSVTRARAMHASRCRNTSHAAFYVSASQPRDAARGLGFFPDAVRQLIATASNTKTPSASMQGRDAAREIVTHGARQASAPGIRPPRACFLIFPSRRTLGDARHSEHGAARFASRERPTRCSGASPERKIVPFVEFLVDAFFRMLLFCDVDWKCRRLRSGARFHIGHSPLASEARSAAGCCEVCGGTRSSDTCAATVPSTERW